MAFIGRNIGSVVFDTDNFTLVIFDKGPSMFDIKRFDLIINNTPAPQFVGAKLKSNGNE